jgi:hypothetical protein
MESLVPISIDLLVKHTGSALSDGGSALKSVPGLVRQLLERRAWDKRVCKLTGETVCFESFAELVVDTPPHGLGSDLETIRRLCAGDRELMDLMDQDEQRPHGGDRKSEQIKSYNITLDPNPRGTSAEGALRRLREQAPEIHARVLAGELSPHGGMVEAGFRRRTIQVDAEDVGLAAKKLLKHFSQAELIKALK